MPLSEDEQRMLDEIEQQLYETDPSLAHGIADTTVYSDAYRQLKWSIAGFVFGVLVMIFTLSVSVLLAVGGVLIMFAAALYIETSLRRMGNAGLDQIKQSMRAAGLRDYLGQRDGRMRDRFRRDEETES